MRRTREGHSRNSRMNYTVKKEVPLRIKEKWDKHLKNEARKGNGEREKTENDDGESGR